MSEQLPTARIHAIANWADSLGDHGEQAATDLRALATELERLRGKNERLAEVLRLYANRENWGYCDDSGCMKGIGTVTEACFIGPEPAEAALAAKGAK